MNSFILIARISTFQQTCENSKANVAYFVRTMRLLQQPEYLMAK